MFPSRASCLKDGMEFILVRGAATNLSLVEPYRSMGKALYMGCGFVGETRRGSWSVGRNGGEYEGQVGELGVLSGDIEGK